MWGRARVVKSTEWAGQRLVSQVKAVNVEISVVLGRTRIPVASLLKMDVGTVVELAAVFLAHAFDAYHAG